MIRSAFRFFMLPVVMFVLAYSMHIVCFKSLPRAINIADIESSIAQKQQQLDEYISELLRCTKADFLAGKIIAIKELELNKDISVLISHDKIPIYWSDYTLDADTSLLNEAEGSRFVKAGNYWVIRTIRKSGGICAVGCIKVKTEYSFENKYIRNSYATFLNIPESTDISGSPEKGYIPIHDGKNSYLFSLKPTVDVDRNHICGFVIQLFCILGFFFLLYAGRKVLLLIESNKRRFLYLLGYSLILLILKAIMVYIKVPVFVYELELFSPHYFAASDFFASLGDVLLFTIILGFFVFNLYREITISSAVFTRYRYVFLAGLMVLVIFCFVGLNKLFGLLIINSMVPFEVYRFNTLNFFSFVSFTVIAMYCIMLVLLVDKAFGVLKQLFSMRLIGIAFMIFTILVGVFFILEHLRSEIILLCFFVLICVIIAYKHDGRQLLDKHSRMIIIMLIMSVFVMYLVNRNLTEKNSKFKKVLAVKLSVEHDPAAEMLLEHISHKICADTQLSKLVTEKTFIYEDINAYLRNTYFNGFWFKYDFQSTFCRPDDSVLVASTEQKWHPCYLFFDDMLKTHGMSLATPHFYFLDIANGRINYLGVIPLNGHTAEMTLFIELSSRLIYEPQGYPELLLDHRAAPSAMLKNYSYAKYFRDELISRYGNYTYSMKNRIAIQDAEFLYKSEAGYDHLVYKINGENCIIISTPSVTFFDLLIGSSYLFIIFYIFLLILQSMFDVQFLRIFFRQTLTRKIQMAMILVLLISFFLIAGGAILLNIKQYTKGQDEILESKIESVYTALDQQFAFFDTIDFIREKKNIETMLVRLSDMLYTDINLYDTDGSLVATSRGEVFEKKLLGSKMNFNAFRYLKIDNSNKKLLREKIGDLSYVSAYMPFMNSRNKVLAYINLPHFTKPNKLKEEISGIIVAAVNIYMILVLLAFVLAVFISDNITKPLKLIQQRLADLKIGLKNEHIRYNANDEIGKLVTEYNGMVDELARNVELLARSEREAAWREMAKQVAHEIKNPLTPMKLSVQQLLKRIQEQPQDTQYVHHFSKTMIEQIDNLASIASAFSLFAQMPQVSLKNIKIQDVINHVLKLYEHTENAKITAQYIQESDLFVLADKDYLTRALINILTNAVQSIPEGRMGEIMITLGLEQDTCLISIQDNGRGIAEEMQEKLFVPNFTTKSGGMGLGLAMTRKIIESFGGRISFKTGIDKGTTFIIYLPLKASE